MNIELIISAHTLGDQKQEYNDRFVKSVKQKLVSEFQSANIEVFLDTINTHGSCFVKLDDIEESDNNLNIYDIRDRVLEIEKQIWDKSEY